MEVHADAGVRRGLAHGLDAGPHRPRVGDSDGVAQGDLRDAQGRGLADYGHHLVLADLPVEGAAEGHRYGQGQARPALIGPALGDGDHGGDLLGHAGALVPDAEAVGGADHHIGLIAAGGHGPVPAAFVQHQANAGQGRISGQALHDLLGAGHLRHPARIHEGHRLDAAHAAGLQPGDEVELFDDLQGPVLVLQPVTGSDFDDLDAAGHLAWPVMGAASEVAGGGLSER